MRASNKGRVERDLIFVPTPVDVVELVTSSDVVYKGDVKARVCACVCVCVRACVCVCVFVCVCV
jgi:hypothetical protein